MLVTLKSTSHDNGISADESASNWTNYFKEGIHFSPDSTVQVVSCSINVTDDFIIERDLNDSFIYAIGVTGAEGNGGPENDLLGPNCQHKVVIPSGSYSGSNLALEIKRQLANSTTFGSMKGTWFCEYQDGDPPAFLIEWTQTTLAIPYNPTDQPSKLPFRNAVYQGAPEAEWVSQETNLVGAVLDYAKLLQDKVNFNELGGDDNIGIGGLIYDGAKAQGSLLNKGTIHCLEGNVNVTIAPTNIITDITPNAFGGFYMSNWNGPGQDLEFEADAKNPNLFNGYEWEFKMADGKVGTINALTPLPNTDALKDFVLLDGGTGWIVGQSGTIATLGGLGAGASFEVLSVDPTKDDALLSYRLENPGGSFLVGDVLVFGNPSGDDGAGLCNSVYQNLLGTNLKVGGVYSLTSAIAGLPGPFPTSAELQITEVGLDGDYVDSVFWQRGADYRANDIVFIDHPDGERAWFSVNNIRAGFDIYFAHLTEEGGMGLSPWAYPHDQSADDYGPEASSNRSEEWSIGFKVGGDENFPNITVGNVSDFFQINLDPNTGPVGHLYGTSPNTPIPAGLIIRQSPGVKIPLITEYSYPSTTIGYIRQQLLREGDSLLDEGHNSQMDLRVSVIPNIPNTDVDVSIQQLQMVGNTFPNGSMIPIKELPLKTIGGLAGFTMGDWINVTIEIQQYTTIIVNIYHDTAGNGTFIANTPAVAQSLVTPVPEATQLVPGRSIFESNLRECMFPLTPVILTDLGTGFDPLGLPRPTDINEGMATPYVTGTVDNIEDYAEELNTWEYDYGTLVTGTEMDDSLFRSLPPTPAGFTPLLPYFFKFNVLREQDFAIAPLRGDANLERSLWRGFAFPNTANMGKTLAFYTVYNFDNNPTDEAMTTGNELFPQPDERSPTIQIELPDFGVKSFSGASHDTGRAVCVIPREQFKRDERTGSLIYNASYPVPIDLRCKDDIVLNHLACRLRNLDGKLSNIVNPTQVTLLIKDSEASVQATAYERAMERVSERDSNRIAMMNAHSIPSL